MEGSGSTQPVAAGAMSENPRSSPSSRGKSMEGALEPIMALRAWFPKPSKGRPTAREERKRETAFYLCRCELCSEEEAR